MTLRRQLFVGISVIFLVIFIGIAALGVSGTRAYLEEQLGSHAQDSASSLVHSLSQSLAEGDRVLAETQLATLFDRGYFQRMLVLSVDGAVLIDLNLPEKIEGVPLWFSSALVLEAPPGEAFLSSGWRQLGKVVVVSQPTYAYQHLWKKSMETLVWMLLVYGLALWLTHVVLRWILNPLSEIERSAKEIQQRRFAQITIKPKALELARVVLAMNNMSRKISEFLDIEIRKAEQFRREAYQDDLTGLDNRRSFDLRLAQALSGEIQFSEAALIGVEVNNLKSFNTEASYSQGDKFLKAIAESAKTVLGEDAPILCRIGGAAFGFVLFDRDLVTLTDLGRRLRDQIDQTCSVGDGQIDFSFSMGMVNFHQGESRARLLSRLDLAIESARQSGHNTLQYVVDLETSESSLGSLAWRDLIRNALAENRWTLLAQPVVSLSSGQLMQQEVMTRLVGSDGHLVPASVFLPMAMRHKLMPDIDKALLSLVFARMEQRQETEKINLAVNLSNQSLENRDFMHWLAARLERLDRRGFTLAFELTEYGCSLDLDASRRFAEMLRDHQVGFGIDHFGLAPGSLQLLRDLPPDYVKLNAGLITEAPGSEASRALVRSIVSLASSLDVEVIAQGVESATQVELLLSDAVKGGQGYHFGAPTAERI
jgi:diguanylate cyclase (GGDEF)-like protein